MKFLSKKEALGRLDRIKSAHRSVVREKYEVRAKNCLTCETQGICCADAHFVNVQITKLEAVAILEHLKKFDETKRQEIFQRINKTVEDFDLKETGDTFSQTFACPLFEKGSGCLIHPVKPVPCVQHACYERREDLPPEQLQTDTELKIEKLNAQTYGKHLSQLPLPVWLEKLADS